jgi:hypothetical protein
LLVGIGQFQPSDDELLVALRQLPKRLPISRSLLGSLGPHERTGGRAGTVEPFNRRHLDLPGSANLVRDPVMNRLSQICADRPPPAGLHLRETAEEARDRFLDEIVRVDSCASPER